MNFNEHVQTLEQFEKHPVVKKTIESFDVYYTNLGGYKFTKDDNPCYYLNGMLRMFMEMK